MVLWCESENPDAQRWYSSRGNWCVLVHGTKNLLISVPGNLRESFKNLAIRWVNWIIEWKKLLTPSWTHYVSIQVQFKEFKIQNLVATVDLRFPIRLENLNQMHGQFSSYEPELFPGLIYRMVKPRVVLLIFVNGKIVFTGAKSKSEINESLENIYPILQSFRKNWNIQTFIKQKKKMYLFVGYQDTGE